MVILEGCWFDCSNLEDTDLTKLMWGHTLLLRFVLLETLNRNIKAYLLKVQ